jgi:hypothetical protein
MIASFNFIDCMSFPRAFGSHVYGVPQGGFP